MGGYVPNTLFRAREILGDATGRGDELVNLLLDAGIGFTETTEVVFEELPLISKDETLRLECLDLAVKSAVPGFQDELPVIKRARYFEQYVRNGAFEGEDHAQA